MSFPVNLSMDSNNSKANSDKPYKNNITPYIISFYELKKNIFSDC